MARHNRAYLREQRDRIIKKRRKRWCRENPEYGWSLERCWIPLRVREDQGNRLNKTDPWDCGNPQCGICHFKDYGWRQREKRQWQQIESIAW